MTLIKPVAEKRFRLRNGELGTEYEAIQECIVVWKAKLQEAEDRLEEYQRRLAIAEGHPGL